MNQRGKPDAPGADGSESGRDALDAAVAEAATRARLSMPAAEPTASRPRCGSTATVDAAVPITCADPLGPAGPEASWENEGGRLLRAIRLEANAAQRAARNPGRAHRDLRALTTGTTGEGAGMTTRLGVRVGRVYQDRTPEDGARVLVDRMWPRGLTKDAADLEEWCKDVAPSSALRTWYGHDPDRFDEFARRYRTELDEPRRAEALQHLRELAVHEALTLVTASRQAEISQAAVLAELLDAESRTGR